MVGSIIDHFKSQWFAYCVDTLNISLLNILQKKIWHEFEFYNEDGIMLDSVEK